MGTDFKHPIHKIRGRGRGGKVLISFIYSTKMYSVAIMCQSLFKVWGYSNVKQAKISAFAELTLQKGRQMVSKASK